MKEDVPDTPPVSLPPFRNLITDPQFIALAVILGLIVGMLYFFGFQLIPFLASIVIAYFLAGGVRLLTDRGLGHGWAVGIVYTAYLVVYVGLLVGPIQIVARRMVELANDLPANARQFLDRIPSQSDPTLGLLPESMREDALNLLLEQIQGAFGVMVSESLGLISQVTAWVMFAFLVPLLVFFFLKDRDKLVRGILRFLPRNRGLATRIWVKMEIRMGRYVRGKIWEILIVGVVSWAAFWILGFEYPVVFGVLSGVSVLVPYVGMVAVAVPLFIQGYLQWSMSWPLAWLLIVYGVIQFLDGNVLVPLMLSHAVKLHPVTILLAVFIFGSLWGFWGVLFAIPLATLFKTILESLLEFREGLQDGQE